MPILCVVLALFALDRTLGHTSFTAPVGEAWLAISLWAACGLLALKSMGVPGYPTKALGGFVCFLLATLGGWRCYDAISLIQEGSGTQTALELLGVAVGFAIAASFGLFLVGCTDSLDQGNEEGVCPYGDNQAYGYGRQEHAGNQYSFGGATNWTFEEPRHTINPKLTEALQALGLTAVPNTREELKTVWLQAIRTAHPDRNTAGSQEAARINAARDYLLNHLSA